jgi:hypothetical protein
LPHKPKLSNRFSAVHATNRNNHPCLLYYRNLRRSNFMPSRWPTCVRIKLFKGFHDSRENQNDFYDIFQWFELPEWQSSRS